MGVAKGSQLGSPERLREKLKMVKKQAQATTVATSTEHRVLSVELQSLQERERNLQARNTALSQRATAAEVRATAAEERATTAEERATAAEERANTSEMRANTAEERATAAEERVNIAEERANVSEEAVQDAQRMLRDLREAEREANRRIQEAEQRALIAVQDAQRMVRDLQQRLADSEHRTHDAERVRNLRARITALSQTATTAEERATTAEERANTSEMRANTAEERATAAEERVNIAEERVNVAEEAVQDAQRMMRDLQQRLADSEHRTRDAERVAEEADRRAQEAEQQLQVEDQPFWVVNREEIQFTEEELGKGGWAEVKVAKFRGDRVAAKCLHTLIISHYNRALFIREMNVAARVRHPNLLLFIGATLQGELIILTELMPSSLRALLEQGELPQQHLITIACDVAKALNYLHLLRPDPIVHRDVSSANVLLDHSCNGNWKAKLSDYGSANFMRQLKTAGPGNPTYAAPEANIPAQQSSKMDIFSFGILLLEMCISQFPDIAVRERLIRSIREPRLVRLVRECTAVDKDRRPSAAELVARLTEL